MAEQRNAPVNATGANCFKEAVCIDAGRIFDSCTDAAAIIGLNRGLTVWSFFDAGRSPRREYRAGNEFVFVQNHRYAALQKVVG